MTPIPKTYREAAKAAQLKHWEESYAEQLKTMKLVCEDCYAPLTEQRWELEDGRTVCQQCCVKDTQRIVSAVILAKTHLVKYNMSQSHKTYVCTDPDCEARVVIKLETPRYHGEEPIYCPMCGESTLIEKDE